MWSIEARYATKTLLKVEGNDTPRISTGKDHFLLNLDDIVATACSLKCDGPLLVLRKTKQNSIEAASQMIFAPTGMMNVQKKGRAE